MSDEPDNHRPPPGVIAQGFEPLSTNTRALAACVVVFVLLCGGMAWGLWGLLGVYLAEPREADLSKSVAPRVAMTVTAQLAPSVGNDDLDWQDLVHSRQREDETLRRIGCTIDPGTGQAVLPANAVAAVQARYSKADAVQESALRFPPPIAPVPAGAAESLPLANVFPPVGAAADAEQTRPSGGDAAPDPKSVDDLSGQSGPAGRHDNPQARPTR